MSTRATYLFKAHDWHPAVCFYIHHDGYEDGAAAYFLNAIVLSQSGNGGLADRFHRANDRAEFTKGHDAHGDTKYRYTVTLGEQGEPMLKADKRRMDDSWTPCYQGTLREFINAHTGNMTDDEKREHLPIVTTGVHLMTNAECATVLDKILTDACQAFALGMTGNASGGMTAAPRYVAALVGYDYLKCNVDELNRRLAAPAA